MKFLLIWAMGTSMLLTAHGAHAEKCEATASMKQGLHLSGVLLGLFETVEKTEKSGKPQLVLKKGVIYGGAFVEEWIRNGEIQDVLISNTKTRKFLHEGIATTVLTLKATRATDKRTCLMTEELILDAERVVPFNGTATL